MVPHLLLWVPLIVLEFIGIQHGRGGWVSHTRLCSITEVCIQQTKSKADTLNILLRESP